MAAPEIDQVREYLAHLDIITIAVIDESGKPWAVPVGAQTYRDGKFTWLSKTNTVHSRAIERNGEVMISAFIPRNQPGGLMGFYARAKVKKTLPTPGFSTYRAEIYEAWYTDNDHQKQQINIQDL